MSDLITASVLALLAFVVLASPAFRRRSLDRALERSAEVAGLAATPEVRPLLVRRYRATWIGSAIGTATGVLLGVLLGSAAGRLGAGFAEYLLPQATWLVTGGIGGLVGRSVGARAVRPTGPRFARDRAVGVDDYLDPIERTATRVAVLIAVMGGGLPLLLGARTPSAWSVAGVAVLVLLADVAAEVGSMLLVSRPQRAGSTVVLAWDDALRSDTVRGLLHAVLLGAAFSLVVAVPAVLAAVGAGGAGAVAVPVTIAAETAVLAVGAFWSGRRRPDRHFLRRLWPGTAARLAANERPTEVRT